MPIPTSSDVPASLKAAPGARVGERAPSVLIMTVHFGDDVRETPLANELSAALAEAGCRVRVLAVQWGAPLGAPVRTLRQENGTIATLVAPRAVEGLGSLVRRASKWTLTPATSYLTARHELRSERFDVAIGFSPAVALSGAFLAGLPRADRSLLYVTDFFPFHHHSLGLVPGGPALEIAKRLETAMFRRFGAVACMSPAGIAYLRTRYTLKPDQSTVAIPLWTTPRPWLPPEREAVRAAHHLPMDKPIAVFGGQLAEGRGIEEILEAARLARAKGSSLHFLFVGRGRLDSLVRDDIGRGAGNLSHIDALPREDYLRLIPACDVGIVCTVRGVDVPTFPSKTLDYLQAGLPVVASVEASTDYGAFIEKAGFGRAGVAGDPARLLADLEAVAGSPETARAMGIAGRRALAEVFDVRHAVERLLTAAA